MSMPHIQHFRILKNKTFYFLFIVAVFLGCSKEDDSPENINNFFNGADSSASIEELVGVWAIFSAEFEGEKTEIPINYAECGRDFFVYSENGAYTEYVYQSSSCEPQINRLAWELNNGILTFTNSLGQTDDFVITKLNSQELVFKSRFDVDEDGELEVFILTANRYKPEEIDLVTNTFNQNSDEAFENLLSWTWGAYDGFNSFDRYEIYRSAGGNCTKANSELIATITNVNTTEYTDLTPPPAESLCYYLKVYTDKGLLGESNYYGVNPSSFIRIDAISLNEPVVSDNNISLSWEPSESPYFSHYEITVSNYGGTSASGAQEYTIAEINDIDVNDYTDENPPYLENPFYAVYTHNIFGNKSPLSDNQSIGFWEVPFKRKEVIDYKKILSLDVDSEEPIVYLYGELSGNGITGVNIRRFNYDTQETESISDIPPQVETFSGIKVFDSPENGKELVIQQGIELHFYDAGTMELKYAIDPEGVFDFTNFTYNESLDVWILVNRSELYILTRDNANLTLISSGPHYPSPQGNSRYELFNLSNQRILVGHFFEPNSIVFSLDVDGNIVDSQFVDFGVGIDNDDKTLLNQQAKYLLDTAENRLYSTDTFDVIESFEFPTFPVETNIDGNLIFGTNNDPDWQISAESPHKKEAVIYDINTKQIQEITTIGYPHFVFEDYNGNLISISTGFKKETMYQNINGKADIFIEQLNLP
jgi:hypothetical protein